MNFEVLNIRRNYGDAFSFEVKAKVENKTRYFDIRVKVSFDNLTLRLSIDSFGVANNKNKNYNYTSAFDNQFRYYEKELKQLKLKEQMLAVIPKEIILFALHEIRSKIEIKVDDEWLIDE